MARKQIKKWTGPATIVWTMGQLETTAQMRGYTIKDVMPCIVKKHEDGKVTVDVNHKDFPRHVEVYGVGTEVKNLLAKIGIVASPTCKCNKRAAAMNYQGIEWCEQNIDLIVSWLREEAKNRKLPFVDLAGRALVKMAIKRARKSIDK
jgi:hypothetical protein